MVSGGSDILFEALNAGRVVGKNWEGWIFVGGALFSDTEWGHKFVHTSLTHICVFSHTAFLSCLTVTFFIKVIKTIEFWYINYQSEGLHFLHAEGS